MERSLEEYEGKQRKRENASQILSKRNSYPEGLQLSISSEELQEVFLSLPLEDFRSLNQESVPGNIDDWDYDVLKYDITTTRQHAFLLFQSLNLIETFALEPAKLMCFIKRISMVYRSNNPFHNWKHGMSTAQAVYFLISHTSIANAGLESIHTLALLTAALGHDLDHPGTNNAFQVEAKTPLAIRYNDSSVLENHHASLLWQLLNTEGSDVFSHLLGTEKRLRQLTISAILRTDMSQHKDLISEFESMTIPVLPCDSSIGGKWIANTNEEKALLTQVLMHAADLSSPARKWHICSNWSERINEEFNAQVEREKSLGLPFAPFMVTRNEEERGRGEMGFMKFAIRPTWNPLISVFPDLHFILYNISENISGFQRMTEKQPQELLEEREKQPRRSLFEIEATAGVSVT